MFIHRGQSLGIATYRVGSNGAVFGVANNTVMKVMDILPAADQRAVKGVLYSWDAVLRKMANNVLDSINNAVDIL